MHNSSDKKRDISIIIHQDNGKGEISLLSDAKGVQSIDIHDVNTSEYDDIHDENTSEYEPEADDVKSRKRKSSIGQDETPFLKKRHLAGSKTDNDIEAFLEIESSSSAPNQEATLSKQTDNHLENSSEETSVQAKSKSEVMHVDETPLFLYNIESLES